MISRRSGVLVLALSISLAGGCASDKDAKPDAAAPAASKSPSNPRPSLPAPGSGVSGSQLKKDAATPPAPGNDANDQAPVGRGAIRVQFGIMPGNYEDTAKGILVGDVIPGTSAADAGIKVDDRLMTWNGKSIDSVGTWMQYMAASKPGDVVDVGVQRGGQFVPVKVTLKARKE